MLTDYDAKAVADVMGIAFLRRSEGDPSAITEHAARAAGPRLSHGALQADIVMRDDGHDVWIVQTDAPHITHGSSRYANLLRAVTRGSATPPSPVLIAKAVELGLPRTVLRHVAECIAGGDKAMASRLEWDVVPRTTLERRTTQLSAAESERTERVARLFVHARRALGSEAEARAFMTAPHPELDGRSPIDAARTDLTTRRAERILNALEYGLAL